MMAKTKGPHHPKNSALSGGRLMKYSRARMFQKKAVYKIKKAKTPKKALAKVKPAIQVKKINGEKNGGERKVAPKIAKSLPTSVSHRKIQLRPKKTFSSHVRRIRPSLQPGTVVILLAGCHKGKRVVLLKQLKSGLLLVTGPMKLNGCPLRRVSQRYVIATNTRINISSVKLPERVNDAYFRRKSVSTKKEAGSGDIFASEKSAYQLSAERKEDQIAVDKAVSAAIAANPDKLVLRQYLSSLFRLASGQRPHEMAF